MVVPHHSSLPSFILAAAFLLWAPSVDAQPLRPPQPITPPPLPSPSAPASPEGVNTKPGELSNPFVPVEPTAPRSGSGAGYLGLTAETAAAGGGVEVLSVTPNSPAAQAMIAQGDIIIQGNRRPLKTVEQMATLLQGVMAGEKVVFEVRRGARILELTATLGERAVPDAAAPDTVGRAVLGVRASQLDVVTASRLGLPLAAGALVTEVIAGSPAAQSQIPTGAIIIRLDRTTIRSPDGLARAVSSHRPNEVVNVQFYTGTRLNSVFVRLGQAEATTQQDLLRPPTATRESVLRRQQIVQELDRIQAEIRQLQQRAKLLEAELRQ